MPKLDLRAARRIKTAGGEVLRLKGAGFAWERPEPGQPSFDPLSVFGAADDGGFWRCDDGGTLWSDMAKTAAAAEADTVAVIGNLLPGGLDLVSATSTRRAVRTQDASGRLGVLFDGVDDQYATESAFTFDSDAVTIVAAMRRFGNKGGILLETAEGHFSNSHSFIFAAGGSLTDTNGPGVHSASRGSAGWSNSQVASVSSPTPPFVGVATAQHRLGASPLSRVRINQASWATSTHTKGNGPFAARILYMGSRGASSFPMDAQVYGLFLINRLLEDEEIADVEQYLAGLAGVTL